jgi:hypothetical protein
MFREILTKKKPQRLFQQQNKPTLTLFFYFYLQSVMLGFIQPSAGIPEYVVRGKVNKLVTNRDRK